MASFVMPAPAVTFHRLEPDAIIPKRQTPFAAAFDLYAQHDAVLSPTKARATVGTGIALTLPPNFVGLVCSRSGLASKEGIFVLNAPGVIDEDYRGELKVVLAYHPKDLLWPETSTSYTIKKTERIAQLFIIKRPFFQLEESNQPPAPTVRNTNGFGSTGR